MSNMASEMAARMREDGRDPATEMIDPTAPAAEPGTGTDRAAPPAAAPPAEALTTDTQSAEGEPGPVPYSRFREVNEGYQNLRGYETLREYGYDPDSLTRLAQFEAAYVQDPTGTIAQLVDNLDVPDETRTQIRELLEVEAGESPAGGGTPATPAGQEPAPPAWAQELLNDKQQREQAAIDAREQAAREAALDEVVGHWNALDAAAGITVREGVKLSLIAAHATSGRYETPQALAEAARAEYLADREAALGTTVVPRGDGIGPRSVPRSAAVPAPPQRFGGDIKAATAAARAAMERGELPPITPGG